MVDFDIKLDINASEFFGYNAKLQAKKNKLRGLLEKRGVLQRGGKNDYDHYSYFSEAQYKELFTELFSKCGLELQISEAGYQMFEGSDKQPNGRRVVLQFQLTDTETGFFETSMLSGEGIDKGDKAIYKAYTGAVKYYLANTFLVATGDDPEKESPNQRTNARRASAKQKQVIEAAYKDNIGELLAFYGIASLDEMAMTDASNVISQLKGAK